MRFLAFALLCAACGNNNNGDAEPYPTMQDCFDDHHGMEGLSIHDAIVVCCLDHPINGQKPACGDTAAACMTFLTTDPIGMLTGTSASSTDIMIACGDYITQKGM